MKFKSIPSTLSFLASLALTSAVALTAKADLPYTQGTMTLTALSGASKVEYPTDPSQGTALKPIIYAGMANSGRCTNTGQVCDSCAAGPPVGFTGNLYPCNSTAAYPDLLLHIEMTTTSTTVYSSGDVGYKIGSGSTLTPTNPHYDSSTKLLTMDIKWSDMCAAMGNSDCTALTSGSQVVTFGLALGSSGVDKMDLQIVVSAVDSSNSGPVYTEACDADGNGTTIAAPYGTCYYKALRGDGKVYLDPIISMSGYPTYKSGINYGGLAVFYAADTPDHIMTQTASRIDFNIASGATKVSENRITGLTNGTTYCFVVANKDITGNVFYYAPVVAGASPSGAAPVDPNTICATPDAVVGLLDDKNCFIATAAFGSQMAPEVETFRAFRNQFLLKNSWGRGFVKTYYKLSPPLANFIAEHETLRTVARGLLWPLLLFAKLSLEWGVLWTALAAAAVTMLLWEAIRRLSALRLRRTP